MNSSPYPEGFHQWPLEGRNASFANAARAIDVRETATAARAWPEPKPVPSGLTPVAAFDMAFLPKTIAPWIADIADRMQCPPDFVAVPAMVALGAVLGRKIAIRPQRRTDWTEVPNLWGCIVGRPGAMKSPAMREALKPLQRLERPRARRTARRGLLMRASMKFGSSRPKRHATTRAKRSGAVSPLTFPTT